MQNKIPVLSHRHFMEYCPRCMEFDIDKGDPCVSFWSREQMYIVEAKSLDFETTKPIAALPEMA
jgi:hypothetical protein